MNKIILVSVAIFFLFACQEAKNVQKSPLLGKIISFPDSLLIVKHGKVENFKANNYENAYKLIISYSGECPSCVSSITRWAEIINELKNNNKIRVFFLMDISDSKFFINNIYPLLPDNELYILNYEYKFQKINKLMVPEIRTHGIVLDINNQIIYDSFALNQNKKSMDYANEILTFIK